MNISSPTDASTSSYGRRVLALAVGLVAVLCVLHVSPIHDLLTRPDRVSDALRGLGGVAPLVFVLATALLVAVGAPRLLLCVIGGVAFGFPWGLIWAELGTVLGSYVTFVLVRRLGREAVVRRWPWIERYEAALRRGGVISVIIAKQLPISGVCLNSLLALTRLTHVQFVVGVTLGTLPQAIPATLAGVSGTQPSLDSAIALSLLACLLFLGSAAILRRLSRPVEEPP